MVHWDMVNTDRSVHEGGAASQVWEEIWNDPPLFTEDNTRAEQRRYLEFLRETYDRTVIDVTSRLVAGGAVLEVGSYMGVVTLSLARAGFRVTASDLPLYINNTRVRSMFEKAGVEMLQVDLQKPETPLCDGQVDAVVMCEVLEHLNFNPVPCLQEMFRILKPGGFLYLALPNLVEVGKRLRLLRGKSILAPIHEYFDQLDPKKNMSVGIHWREYTAEELSGLLTAVGFRRCETAFFVPSRPEGAGVTKKLKHWLHQAIPSFRPNLRVTAWK
jgi:SAM-dependent methyltransferase